VSFSGVFHIHLRSGVRTQTCPLFLMPLRQSPRFPLVLWLFTHAGLREGANPNLSAFCIATATIALICRDSFGLLGRSECGKVRTQTCPLFQAWRPQSPVVHAGREGKLMEKRTFREAPMSGVLAIPEALFFVQDRVRGLFALLRRPKVDREAFQAPPREWIINLMREGGEELHGDWASACSSSPQQHRQNSCQRTPRERVPAGLVSHRSQCRCE
jgi:hypothetical protein